MKCYENILHKLRSDQGSLSSICEDSGLLGYDAGSLLQQLLMMERNALSLSSLLLWRYTPHSFTSASPMTSIHSDQSWAFLVHALIQIILRSTWMLSNHISFGPSTFLFLSSFACKTLFGILLLSILIKWPNYSSLLSWHYYVCVLA